MEGSDAGSIDGLPLVRVAFPRTVRLVPSARLREAVLAPLADDDGGLALLAAIEGATSGRQISEERGRGALSAAELVHGVPHARFINASFAYARPRQPNRFNPADRGAWYAALDVATCVGEVGHHLTRALANAGDFHTVVAYGEMLASMAGLFVDLRQVADHGSLHPDPAIGYPAGNDVAAATRAVGHNGIIYPSVRHAGGTCIAALWPTVVQSSVQGSMVRLTWSGTPRFDVTDLWKGLERADCATQARRANAWIIPNYSHNIADKVRGDLALAGALREDTATSRLMAAKGVRERVPQSSRTNVSRAVPCRSWFKACRRRGAYRSGSKWRAVARLGKSAGSVQPHTGN